MAMTEEQRDRFIAERMNEGASLDTIQKELSAEHGINLTFMDLRLIVADLEVNWEAQDGSPDEEAEATKAPEDALVEPGSTSVTVDKVVRPGAVKSGKVTFASGARSEWYLDAMGRLGLQPEEGSAQPNEEDIQQFQQALQQKLSEGML